MLQLRLKDIRIHDRVITVFDGKGGKSRALRVIQEQLGHTSLETTELYLHTAGKRTVASPLDRVIIPHQFHKSA